MRRYGLLFADVALISFATLVAFALRENFEFSQIRLIGFLPYFVITAIMAALLCPFLGLNRAVWRFTDVPDYVRVAGAVTLIVASSVAIDFAYDRLDGVARSLPVLQLLVAMAFLIGARMLHRLAHSAKLKNKRPALLQPNDERPALTLLIVGVNRLAETYLQAIAELAPNRFQIAGLVGDKDRQTGRLIASHPVLGIPEDIDLILDRLELHGVSVDRIVVATSLRTLSPQAREALLETERSRALTLQILAEDLGLGSDVNVHERTNGSVGVAARPELSFEIDRGELDALTRRTVWKIKRTADIVAACLLLPLGLPVMGVVYSVVALSIGFPVLFWQQRPGLGGQPFRLYKFRTMLRGRGPNGEAVVEVPAVGALLRRTRLDELPQLFNILRGDMSFIGPRPLLPCDQSDAHRARLLVRPGLTGWAQVVGGRDISPEDKATLDVWYVQNASLILDLNIALKTVPMVLFGERISRPLIERAWRDLSRSGVLKADLEAI